MSETAIGTSATLFHNPDFSPITTIRTASHLIDFFDAALLAVSSSKHHHVCGVELSSSFDQRYRYFPAAWAK